MNSNDNGTINNMLDQIEHAASVSSDVDATMTSTRSSSNNDNGDGSGNTGFVAMVRKSITRRLSSSSSGIIIPPSAGTDDASREQQHQQRSKEDQVEDLRGDDDDTRTVHSDSEDEYDDISLHDRSESENGDGDIEAAVVMTTYQKGPSTIATEQHYRKSSRRIVLLVFFILALVIAIVIGLVVGLREDKSGPQSSLTQDVQTTIDPDAVDPTTSRTDTPTTSSTTTTTTGDSKPSIPPLNLNDLTSPSSTSSSSSSSFLRPDKDRLQTLVHGSGTTTSSSTSTEQEDEVGQMEESTENEKEDLVAISESCVPINPCNTDPTSTDYSFDEGSDHWQCLVGYNATDAEQLILQHYPTKKFTISILPEFSPITMDLRYDRIRIFTSKQGCVNKAPYIG